MSAASDSGSPGVILRGSFGDHHDMIGRIAWSPDGRWLATPSNDRTVGIWDAETRVLTRLLTPLAKGYRSLSATGQLPTLVPGFYAVAFSRDGRHLATASGDGIVRLWDSLQGSVEAVLVGHRGKVVSVAFSPRDGLLASGSEDMTVGLWNPASGELVRQIKMPQNGDEATFVFSLAFSPDGERMATGNFDGCARIWDLATGELQQELSGHRGAVYSVVWLPRGEGLATASNDGTVAVWNAASGQRAALLEGHQKAVFCLSASGDNRFLASKSWDGTVRLWRSDTWDCVATFSEPSSGWWASGLTFHPRSLRLATLDRRDQRVRIWDLDPGALLAARAEHLTARTPDHSAALATAESVILANTLNRMAVDVRNRGQIGSALALYEKALDIRLTIPDYLNASVNCRNISQVHLMLGRLPEAAEVAKRALDYAERIMDTEQGLLEQMASPESGEDVFEKERWALGFSYAFYATAEAMMGHDEQAREAFSAAAEAERRPVPVSIHVCWYAMWLSRLGLTDRAREALGSTELVSEDPKRLHETCLFRVARAWVERHALARGEAKPDSLEQMVSDGEAAVEVGRKSESHWYLASALLEAGRCQVARAANPGKRTSREALPTAQRRLEEARQMAEAAGYRLILADLFVARAELALQQREMEVAGAFCHRAVDICRDADCGYAWAREDAAALLRRL